VISLLGKCKQIIKRSRREKKKSRTQRFHPSSRVTSSPLQTSKDFH